jgi:hypothetical protein
MTAKNTTPKNPINLLDDEGNFDPQKIAEALGATIVPGARDYFHAKALYSRMQKEKKKNDEKTENK